MSEIKIKPSIAEPVFNDLKTKSNDLDTTKPNLAFNQSILDFIQKIEDIEANYYQILNDYKHTLLKVEHDAWSNVESFIEVEENVASNISKGSGR